MNHSWESTGSEERRSSLVPRPGFFPQSAGFVVDLSQQEGRSGKVLRFLDPELGVLAEFSWWDDVETDLVNWTMSDIPLGTTAAPFDDEDQHWYIQIWRRADRVFLAQGDTEAFSRSAWVPVERYFAAWRVVLSGTAAQAKPQPGSGASSDSGLPVGRT